jgi:hypothetical protein
MSKAARKTKRLKRHTAGPQSTLTAIDLIYRRLTGNETGLAPVGRSDGPRFRTLGELHAIRESR